MAPAGVTPVEVAEPALADLGITRRFIDVGGVRTSYLESGPATEDAPTLLLLHGGDFSSLIGATDWVPQLAELGGSFRVVALDRLGQGHTGNPVDDYGYDMRSVCRHVAAFVEALGVGRFAVAGHSRGALPAIRLALADPVRVPALVVFDSNTLTPSQDGSTRAFYARARERRPEDTDVDLARREPALNSYAEDHLTDDYIGSRVRTGELAKTQEAHARMRDEDVRSAFLADIGALRVETLDAISRGGLTSDTLVVWGDDDPSAPLARGLELYRLLSAAPGSGSVELHVVDRAGHYSFRERARDVNPLLVQFLERRLGAA